MVAISGGFNSFNALLDLRRAEKRQEQSILRLSTGEHIQRAEDAPAELSISNNLRSEVKALKQLKRAHYDGINAINLGDAQLEEVSNLLYRVGELATQAASSVAGDDFSRLKADMNLEYQELLQQIDQLNTDLKLNDRALFFSSVSFDVAATVHIDDPGVEQTSINFSSFSTTILNLAGTDLNTSANADVVLQNTSLAIDSLSRQRGRLGAVQKRLRVNFDSIDQHITNTQGLDAQIRDANVSTETVSLTKSQIMSRSAISVIAQSQLSPDRVFQLIS